MKFAILGILLRLIGGVTTAFGWAFMKKAYNRIQGLHKSVLRKPLWWIGCLLTMLSQPMYMAGVAMANQSTIGVLSPFSLIANISKSINHNHV